VLTLCQIQQGDHGRLLIVSGIFAQYVLDAFVIFLGKIKKSGRIIVGSVNVLNIVLWIIFWKEIYNAKHGLAKREPSNYVGNNNREER
jgi:hypothetical protein